MPSWLPIALTILIALGFIAWLSRVFRAGVQTTELQPFIEMVVSKAITDAIVREDGAIRKRLDEQKKLIEQQDAEVKALRVEFSSAHAGDLKHHDVVERGTDRIELAIEELRLELKNEELDRFRQQERFERDSSVVPRRPRQEPVEEERPARPRTPAPRPRR